MREHFHHPLFRLPYLRRFQAMTLAPWWILYREPHERVDFCMSGQAAAEI